MSVADENVPIVTIVSGSSVLVVRHTGLLLATVHRNHRSIALLLVVMMVMWVVVPWQVVMVVVPTLGKRIADVSMAPSECTCFLEAVVGGLPRVWRKQIGLAAFTWRSLGVIRCPGGLPRTGRDTGRTVVDGVPVGWWQWGWCVHPVRSDSEHGVLL